MLVTQKVSFECSYLCVHASSSTGSPLNSHRYTLEVEVTRNDQDKFIIEFSELNKVLQRIVPDGCWLFGSVTSDVESQLKSALIKVGVPIKEYPFDISTEALCEDVAKQISEELAFDYSSLILKSVKLQENENSAVVWNNNN